MEIIADLHIHSKYSRATSIYLDMDNLVKYSKIKGLNLLGTGDFTHPKWFAEIKKLEDKGQGILYYKDFPFLLSSELSLVYTKGKGRRIHYVMLAPNLEIVEQINSFLLKQGRLDYDGRPIFGFSSEFLLDNLLSISKEIEIIPAHVWTPWFGIFGSMSGFDSLKEAFGDKAKHIHSIETGMSSDPEMNWRLSELNEKTIVSFSDAHSFHPYRIGREATIFNAKNSELNYKDIINQIRNNEISGTIEVDPAYGKYHYDGHRLCNFSCSPEHSKKLGNICPICKKQLIIGVENRVKELADQPLGFKPKNAKPFYKILPLQEIIAMVYGVQVTSKKVLQTYNEMIANLGNEFSILLHLEKEKLAKNANEKIIEMILLNREGKIKVKPGYDGVYGEAIMPEKQAKLV